MTKPKARRDNVENKESRQIDADLQNIIFPISKNEAKNVRVTKVKETVQNERHEDIKFWGSKDSYISIAWCSCCIFFFAILGLVISLMTIHFSNDQELSIMFGGIDNMISNLEADPIYDIKFVNFASTCPEQYSLIDFGSWPGTTYGCLCPNGGLKRGACNKTPQSICSSSVCIPVPATDTECQDIEKLPPFQLEAWDGIKWCAKRAKLGSDYLKKAACPDGFRECSVGVCMKNSLECPITSFSLSSSSVNSESIKYSDSKYFTPIREIGKSPIIGASISVNDIPCFSQKEIPDGTTESYLLLEDIPKGCAEYGPDIYWSFEVDKESQENVLKDNNLPSSVFELPQYDPILKATTTILAGRNRISVIRDDRCMDIDVDSIEDLSEEQEYMSKVLTITTIIILVLHGIALITIFTGISSPEEHRHIAVKMVLGLFGLEVITIIVMSAISIYCYYKFANFEKFFGDLGDLNCFQVGQPHMVFHDYQELVGKVVGKLRNLCVATLIVALGTYLPLLISTLIIRKEK